MAIAVWSNWSPAGSNSMRVGADYTIDPVDTNTATFHIHYWFYVQTQYTYSGDVQALNFAGWFGGSQGYTLSSPPNGVTLVAERDAYYNYVDWGSNPGNIQVSATVSGAYNGSAPSLFLDIPIWTRPYAPPNPPPATDFHRDSDTQIWCSWTSGATGQRPWTSVSIDKQGFGTAGWGPWVGVATVHSPGVAFADNAVTTNKIWAYRIRSNNTVGTSAWVYPTWVYTTPAAPTLVKAVLGPTGTTIPITWKINHYSAASTTLVIERSVAGGAYAGVASGLAWNTTTWTDPTPGAGTNQYRIRSSNNGNGGAALTSAWATSNVVATVVAPLAPTQLAPSGTAVDVQYVGATLTWLHNPGGDFAAQSHYTIETSDDGGAVWDPLVTNVASAVSSHTLAAGVLTNGVTYLWRVKTQGGTTAAFGPFSTAATFTAETTPTATLTAPVDPLVALPLSTTWVYNQDESVPQAAWEARLYAADGATLLEQQTGSGTTDNTPFAYPVTDGVTYVVAVRVQSGSGMWSAWATTTTTVDLPPPAPVHIEPTYDPCTGVMVLYLWSEVPDVGEVAVDYVTVERRVAGGDWVVIARDIAVPTTILDMLPLTNGLNEYRVTSFSTTPSVVVNPIVTAAGTDGGTGSPLWAFVSYGQGFSTVLRVRGDLNIQDKPSRVQNEQPFLGRRKPVLLTGIGISRQLSVSGSLRYADPCPPEDTCRYDSPPNDWLDAAWNAGVVAYRDYTGRRFFASIDLQVTDGWWSGNASLSMTLVEVDYVELGGVLFGGALDGGTTMGSETIPGLCAIIDGGSP